MVWNLWCDGFWFLGLRDWGLWGCFFRVSFGFVGCLGVGIIQSFVGLVIGFGYLEFVLLWDLLICYLLFG